MSIYLFVIAFFMCFKVVRCVVFNLHYVGYYGLKDFIKYFKEKKWEDFNHYGIDMFVAMFGHGKTLSMTRKARRLYNKFGDSLVFYSNYELKGIPYIPLVNFNQLVELGEEMPDGVQGYVVISKFYCNQ